VAAGASHRHLPSSNKWALVLLFGTIAALYFAREILIPLAFALILTFVLSPVVALLHHFEHMLGVRYHPGTTGAPQEALESPAVDDVGLQGCGHPSEGTEVGSGVPVFPNEFQRRSQLVDRRPGEQPRPTQGPGCGKRPGSLESLEEQKHLLCLPGGE